MKLNKDKNPICEGKAMLKAYFPKLQTFSLDISHIQGTEFFLQNFHSLNFILKLETKLLTMISKVYSIKSSTKKD
jgi:hypothetical protein